MNSEIAYKIIDDSVFPLVLIDYNGKIHYRNKIFSGKISDNCQNIVQIFNSDNEHSISVYNNILIKGQHYNQICEILSNNSTKKICQLYKMDVSSELIIIKLIEMTHITDVKIPILLTHDNIIIYSTNLFRKTYKISDEDIIGKNIFDILGKKEILTDNEYYTLKNGKLEYYLDLYRYNSFDDIVVNQFLDTKKHLIKEHIESIKSLHEKEKDAIKTKERFIANISHEFRTPLNGIYGMLTLLSETNISEKNKEYIDICLRSVDALANIIDDILIYSKLDSKGVVLNNVEFNVEKIIEDVMLVCGTNIKYSHKDIDIIDMIEPNVNVFVKGDPGRIRQILINLVGNSVKFTQSGHILIKVSIESNDPYKLHIMIEDTGIGIPDDKKDKIFKPFNQVDNSVIRKYGGSGLGLSITKKLVKLIGGEIWFESEVGVGTKFHVIIPLIESKKNNVLVQYDITNNDLKVLKGKKVYIIDDNIINCKSLQYLLRTVGIESQYNTDPIKSIDELVELNKIGVSFDLLVIDYNMPDINGSEVSKVLRKDKGIKSKIMIASSSFDKINSTYADASIFKPIKKNILLKLISRSIFGINTISDSINIPIARNKTDKVVLIVDDNSLNRLVLEIYLKKMNINFISATNGQEAIKYYNEDKDNGNHIGLIFMDIHMPVMNGIDASKIIKVDNSLKPIVVITGDISSSVKYELNKLNITDLLYKPINSDDIALFVNRYITTNKKLSRYNVIVIDDSETNLIVSKLMLEKYNINVTTVQESINAIDIIRNNDFDIVITDIMMPDMDGYELISIIKQFYNGVIIAMTGLNDDDNKMDIYRAGINDIINKPIIPNLIEGILSKYINLELETNDSDNIEILDNLININKFINNVGSNFDMCVNIINVANNQLKTDLKLIDTYIVKKEYNVLYELFHKAKGCAAQVYYTELTNILTEICDNLKKNVYSDLENNMTTLKSIFDIVINKKQLIIDKIQLEINNLK